MSALHVFTSDYEKWVAPDLETLAQVYRAATGIGPEDEDLYPEWDQMPDDAPITIHGEPFVPSDCACPVTRTAGEWARLAGRTRLLGVSGDV